MATVMKPAACPAQETELETIKSLGFEPVWPQESYFKVDVPGDKPLVNKSRYAQPIEELPEVKPAWPSPKEWAAALRSGDYKQGLGALRRDRPTGPEHCCLGVLAELAGVRKAKYVVQESVATYRFGLHEVVDRIPMSMGPEWMSPTEQEQFINWNDKCGMSFNQIADNIDQMYPD